ncbi:MAG: hypothetical protein RI958_638 [Actinomycetota bacterium]
MSTPYHRVDGDSGRVGVMFVRVVGGLGNQLFQVAAALWLRRRRGGPVALDTSWYDQARGAATPRTLELVPDPAMPTMCSMWTGCDGVPAVVGGPELGEPHWVEELSGDVGVLDRVTAETSVVAGYFQQSRVALEVLDELRPWFVRRRASVGASSTGGPYVSVHVRLGDYLADRSTRLHHGLTDPVQQLELGLRVADGLGVSAVRVFTDSPSTFGDLVGDALIDDETRFEQSGASGSWETLFEMAAGSAVVMSNSSLSWWAAFVATQVDGRSAPVWMPTPWFAAPSVAEQVRAVRGWSLYERRQR